MISGDLPTNFFKEPESKLIEEKAKRVDFNIPQPKIKRGVTDKDKDEFLRKTFEILKNYFNMALKQLEEMYNDIQTDFIEVTVEKFRCSVYVDGEKRAQCQLWISYDFSTGSIGYSEGQSFSDNSFNEQIVVEHDGFKIYLRPLMNMYGNREDQMAQRMLVYIYGNDIQIILKIKSI